MTQPEPRKVRALPVEDNDGSSRIGEPLVYPHTDQGSILTQRRNLGGNPFNSPAPTTTREWGRGGPWERGPAQSALAQSGLCNRILFYV